MGEAPRLGELLREHMRRPETFSSIGILSKRSGVPKATIANWLECRVERPRHYLDLLKVAAALHLGASETNALLSSAGYPTLAELRATAARPDEQALLGRWLDGAPAPRETGPELAGAGQRPPQLLGRACEVAAIAQLLLRPEVRLVSLTGPGGVGKTSLALQVAAELRGHFADGDRWVSLAPISAPELVLPALARALGFAAHTGVGAASQIAGLAHALHDWQALLVLDNFEQVAAAGTMLGELLAACPRLKALVTSREALHLPAEREFVVPPLALPPASVDPSPARDRCAAPPADELERWPAVDLFIRRAQASQFDFALTRENAAAVTTICRQLDGLPLAIELAAARIKLLPPASLLARLWGDDGVTSLRLLVDSRGDGPARQRTMRETIAWSYRLLDPDEQRLLRRLAVFVGGFTLDGAEAVAGLGEGTLDGLSSLINKSLLRPPDPADSQGRLALLETIRAFGLEQLAQQGELADTRRCHAHYILALIEAGEPGLRSPQQDYWLERLAPDLENVRAALEWSEAMARAGGPEAGEAAVLAVRLAGVVWRFGIARGYMSETRRWLERAISTLHGLVQLGYPGLATQPGLGKARLAWAKALIGIGMVARMQGDLERATTCLAESLVLGQALDDRTIIADALISLGNVAWLQDDLARTEELFTQCLALYRELGDDLGIIWALNGLGNVSLRRGDYPRASRLHQEGLEHARRIGFKRLIAWSLSNQGSTALEQGDLRRAEVLLDESLSLLRALRDRQGIAHALYRLGAVNARQADPARATAFFEQSLALHRELGDQYGAHACAQGLRELEARRPAPTATVDEAEKPRACPATGRSSRSARPTEGRGTPRRPGAHHARARGLR